MTPGPTKVRENVRLARSLETTNSDLDPVFYDEYRELCKRIAELLHTKNEVYILCGEGILGLEAACASLTEKGDRVLVIDNGLYGNGFKDFVTLYGGTPVLYQSSYEETISVEDLAKFLEKDHSFKYATMVHNDTPSGMTNNVHAIGPLLHQYGILTVVDSVSGMIGEELKVDDACLDIVLGGSQKAFSAPTGLTIAAVSQAAMESMDKRKTPIASFYANLKNFRNYYEEQWFPYTMPISDIYGLRAAVDNVFEEPDIVGRHRRIAEGVRAAITSAGLSLYGKNGYSNNVTVFRVPEGITDTQILEIMKKKYQIMLAGSFGPFAGKVIRIGHMGENANDQDMIKTLKALQGTLQELGFICKVRMEEIFKDKVEPKR